MQPLACCGLECKLSGRKCLNPNLVGLTEIHVEFNLIFCSAIHSSINLSVQVYTGRCDTALHGILVKGPGKAEYSITILDNFYIFPLKYCGYSLKLPCRGDSTEQPKPRPSCSKHR